MLAAPPEVDMTQNFYKLPAGLMVGILSDPKSKKRAIYQPIDPNDLKIPPSIALNPEITDLLTEYYANIFDSKSKNRYGFEKKFEVSNSNIFDLDLPAQPTPELIEKFKKEIELNSKPEKTKKQIIDEMVIEYSDTNSGEESIDEDEFLILTALMRNIGRPKLTRKKISSSRLSRKATNPIESTNKGHKFLQKMGWKEGKGLGVQESGIVAPIKASNVRSEGPAKNLGLGAPGSSNETDHKTPAAPTVPQKDNLEIENFRQRKRMLYNQKLDMRTFERKYGRPNK